MRDAPRESYYALVNLIKRLAGTSSEVRLAHRLGASPMFVRRMRKAGWWFCSSCFQPKLGRPQHCSDCGKSWKVAHA